MKRKGISIALVLFALLIPFFVFAYTSPGKPTGYVNDFANIISDSEQIEIEAIISNYEKQSGNEIAVVTIQSLGDEDIDGYAVKLFEDWKIGKANKDNGLLMLFSMDERKMRIEVGYGLEPYITDALATNIRTKILTPAFQSGKYTEGIRQAIETIIGILQGTVDAEYVNSAGYSANYDSKSDEYVLPVVWAIFFLMWLTSILGRSKSWWLGGVMGGIFGIIVSMIYFTVIIDIIFTIIMIIIGLIFDFIVSRVYYSSTASGVRPPWWIGGGGLGGRGGGFGGFGGGGSGGGGSSGGW